MISARLLSASACTSSEFFAATTICRLISASSSTRRRFNSSSLCSRSRSIRALSSASSSAICSRSVSSRDLHLGFVDQPPAGDFALLDFFLVLDARLGEIALLNEFRLLHLFARREQRLLALLIANGAIPGQFDALRGAAHFDVVLLREPRIFALAIDIERLALRVEILRPDFDLRALLDFVAHAPARLRWSR